MSRPVQAKPDKPSPDFPLYAHRSGKWAKKIRGSTVYFGRWGDPDAAMAEYSAYLAKGPEAATPASQSPSTMTVRYCCNLFLTDKSKKVLAGENASRTFADYKRTCGRIVVAFGAESAIESLGPADFSKYKAAMAAKWNPVNVGNEVTRIKTLLKWLGANKFIGAVDTGPDFRKPSRLVTRRYRRSVGKKLYSATDIRLILDEAGIHLRAMILLGINCGFQNSDCEALTLAQARLATETGWVEAPRVKTEVDRRACIWKETSRAITRSLARRPSSPSDVFFLLPDGRPFSSSNGDIAKRFRAARDHAMIRSGGYSWLRKTFETVAGLSKDQVAIDAIMGHVDSTMGGVYRQEIQDERLAFVSRAVGRWLWA